MLLWLHHSKLLGSKLSIYSHCPNCGSSNTLQINSYSRYLSIFFVPFFAYRKIGKAECLNCQSVFKYKQMPQMLKDETLEFKKTTPLPLWNFIGFGLLFIYFPYRVYEAIEIKKLEREYLKKPLINDIYTYHSKSDHYSSLKIVGFDTNNNIIIKYNKQEVDDAKDMNKYQASKYYKSEKDTLTRDQMEEFYNNKSIKTIARQK